MEILTVLAVLLQVLHSLVAEDCESERVSGNHGNIKDPVYPYIHPNNYCKYWFIQGGAGKTITLQFKYLWITGGSNRNCSKYYLQVGPDPVKWYCGHMKAFNYTSTHDHVWFKYKTDSKGDSFYLTYNVGNTPTTGSTTHKQVVCKETELKCMLKYYNREGCLRSNLLCNGNPDCLNGEDEHSSLCHDQYKQLLYQGQASTTQSPAVNCPSDRVYCQSRVTKRMICLSSVRLCDGISDCLDGADERSGRCRAGSKKACIYYIDKKYGTITSPGYPWNYPNSISCGWKIHSVIPGRPVQLRFNDFQVEADKNTDYLVVYDGQDTSSPLLGVFNGLHTPPAVIESDTDWVYVRFRTDAFVNRRGFNITYQTKGICMKNQKPCGGLDHNCYDPRQQCDGVWDCKQHGTDEKGCYGCSAREFSCGMNSSKCYHEEVRCDGNSYCFDYSDEKNCSSLKCGPHRGLFLCDNGRCIYETWKCDNSDDCQDGSDENDCSGSTTRVIIAAVVGSMVCSLLLVVALGCTCRLYLLRSRDSCRQRHSTPLSRLQIEIMGRRPPPPSYNEAMLTSRPYEEVRQEILSRNTLTTGGEMDMSNRPLPVPPYEAASRDVTENDITGSQEFLIPESNSDTETSGCDNTNYLSDDDDELLDLNEDSDVNIPMTGDVALLAAWRSNPSLHNLDNASGDTQLIDITVKNLKKCDKNSNCATSDSNVESTPSDSNTESTPSDSKAESTPRDSCTESPHSDCLESASSSTTENLMSHIDAHKTTEIKSDTDSEPNRSTDNILNVIEESSSQNQVPASLDENQASTSRDQNPHLQNDCETTLTSKLDIVPSTN